MLVPAASSPLCSFCEHSEFKLSIIQVDKEEKWSPGTDIEQVQNEKKPFTLG
jgi:hypothetical protein